MKFELWTDKNKGGQESLSEQPAAPLEIAPHGSGKDDNSAAPITKDGLDRAIKRFMRGAAYAEAVTIYMRSPAHRERKIGDLSWMLVPPFLASQYTIARVASADKTAAPEAIGMITWACVSDELDQKFSRDADQPIEIGPAEWTSGPHNWIIDMIADTNTAAALIEHLKSTAFAGQSFKILATGDEGKRKVHVLQGSLTNQSAA